MHSRGGSVLASLRYSNTQFVVQAITADDVKSYMKKLLATKPSGVLLGDQSVMPKFDSVKTRFQ